MLDWFKNNKFTILSLILFSLVITQLLHPRTITKTQTVTQIVTVEKKVTQYVDRVHYVDRVRTITITKKDGTKIVERDTTNSTDKTNTTKQTNTSARSDTKSVTQIVAQPTRYHLGILGVVSPLNLSPALSLYLGARLGNFPLFLDLQSVPQKQLLGAGFSYEF